MDTHSMLWVRLDTPGHDACRVLEQASGCEIQGTAVFRHNGVPAQLAYQVVYDAEWRARFGVVRGFVGAELVNVRIERAAGGAWTLNGETVAGLEDCVHLDFGFTPATNFPQLRQLQLAVGQAADLPAAWLDVFPSRLERLPQRYERRSETEYWYEAPGAGYSALLEVTPAGFVRRYPGLWEVED
jgi:hypothetical protein